MFVSESTSFHLIASFSFEFILMPEMLLEEGYLRYLSDLLLHLDICHFYHDYCVHDMPMSSTYVLLTVFHLSRGATHVFLWCVWWLAQACKVVQSLMLISGTWHFHQVLDLFISICHMFMLFPSDPCLFWGWSVRMFCWYCSALSIHVFVCNYGAP